MPRGAWSADAMYITVMLLMTAIAGCTISIQPWTKPQPAPPVLSDPVNPNMLMKNGMPQQNMHASNEVAARMEKNLLEEQELRRAVQNQVGDLKRQVKEREDNLRYASYEMEESTKQMKRTREDFRQWQAETEELRERIRKLEEYRASAKPFIEDIYRFLDRDKEPAIKFKSSVPKE